MDRFEVDRAYVEKLSHPSSLHGDVYRIGDNVAVKVPSGLALSKFNDEDVRF